MLITVPKTKQTHGDEKKKKLKIYNKNIKNNTKQRR